MLDLCNGANKYQVSSIDIEMESRAFRDWPEEWVSGFLLSCSTTESIIIIIIIPSNYHAQDHIL